jgi:DNA-binding transcriptional LysR family regulator
MDIEQLRAFLAVAEELHFGRAAERLHIAQPPLSRTIKQLERQLGTRLFDRNTRSVKLTSSGQALVNPALEVLETLRRAEAAVRSADNGELGLVRIAFAGISTHRLVARLARAVRSQRPGIQLELSSQDFAQPAMKKLVQGDTDIALGRWDVVPPEVSARVVMPDSLVVALPDTHALAGTRQLSIGELTGASFISLPLHEGSVLSDRLRRLAHANGFAADIVQVAPDTQTALALVSAEVGCHLTLASVARNVDDPHVVFIALADSTPTLDVHLRAAWRRTDDSPALKAVLAELLALDNAAPG